MGALPSTIVSDLQEAESRKTFNVTRKNQRGESKEWKKVPDRLHNTSEKYIG